jgi:hypothetical protein
MADVFFSRARPAPPERDDDQRTDERLIIVERELHGLQQRLDRLLIYIRRDEVAPLTPAVLPIWAAKDDPLD